MVGCEDIREALSASLDGEVTALERAAVEAHLGGCARCATFAAGLRQMHTRMAALPSPAAPASLRERIAALALEESAPQFVRAQGARWTAWMPRFVRTPAFAMSLIMLFAVGAFMRSSGMLLPDSMRELVAEHLAQRQAETPATQGIGETGDQLRTTVAAYANFTQDPQVEGDFLRGQVTRVCESDAAHFAFTDQDGRPLSLFVMPASCQGGDWGTAVQHHGKVYNVARYRGHTIVSWKQKGAFCVLLCPSTDHELLEQAHHVQLGFDENPS